MTDLALTFLTIMFVNYSRSFVSFSTVAEWSTQIIKLIVDYELQTMKHIATRFLLV